MERPPVLRIRIFKALLKAQLQRSLAPNRCSLRKYPMMWGGATILITAILLGLGELAGASLQPITARGADAPSLLADGFHGWLTSALLLLVATAAGLCCGTIRRMQEIEWLRSLALLPCEVEVALLAGLLPRIAGLAAILLIPAFHATGVHSSDRLWNIGWAILLVAPTSLLALSVGALLARCLRSRRVRWLVILPLVVAGLCLAATPLADHSSPIARSTQPFPDLLKHPIFPSAQLAHAAIGIGLRDTHGAIRSLAFLWAWAFTGTAAALAIAAQSGHASQPIACANPAATIRPDPQSIGAGWLQHPGLRASLAFARKDWHAFWKDPLQWGHLIWILLLTSLELLALHHAAPEFAELVPQRALPGMVVALCMLTAAPLASRFIYPLPCCEVPRMWMLKAAPGGVRAMIRSQFILGSAALFAFGAWMQTAASLSLGLQWQAQLPLLCVTCGSSAASTAIALAAAACFPAPFSEDPARIASSLRASAALGAGLTHALGCAAIECLPALNHPSLDAAWGPFACHAACIALNLAITTGLLHLAAKTMGRPSTIASA